MLKSGTKKGQLSIITRIFFIISLLVLLVIFAAQLTFYNSSTRSQIAKYDVVFFAEDIARVLMGSQRCLVADREGVLSEEKLNSFANDYADREAECARVFGYGWRAEVNAFEANGSERAWLFGSQVSDTPSIKIKLPVSVKTIGEGQLPGLLTLQVASGELEQVAGMVDSSCANAENSRLGMLLKDRLVYESGNNSLCSLGTKTVCRKLACGKQLLIPELLPGSHTLRTRVNATSLEVLP